MSKTKAIRILVAHNQPLLRDGLRYRIEQQPDMKVVAEAGTLCQAVKEFLLQRPDVSVLDLEAPVGRSRCWREKEPLASVILMMDRDSHTEIYRLLRAGTKAVLLNDSPWWDVMKCIRAVSEGQLILPSEVAVKLSSPASSSGLTTREMAVLREMVEGKSNKVIGTNLRLTEGTVKTHVNHILRKLGTAGRVEACTKALRNGLVER